MTRRRIQTVAFLALLWQGCQFAYAAELKPFHVDPNHDNAPAFNELFEKLGRKQHGPVKLEGRYLIKDTLVFPARMSAVIEGTSGSYAMADAAYSGSGQGGATCGFIWGGPPDKPMFRVKGSMVRFSGIHFQGAHADLTSQLLAIPLNKCAAQGVLVETQQNGIATGYVHFDHCSFAKLQTCIQCGEDNPLADNAEGVTSSGTLWVSHVGTFLKVRNRQSIAHHFAQVNLWFTDVGFDFERGGGLTVDSCQVVGGDCIVLQTDKLDVNTGRIVFTQLKLDNTGAKSQVLNMKSASPLHLSVGLHVGNGIQSQPLLTVRGPARIRLNEAMGLPAKAFLMIQDSGIPRVTVDGGTFRKGLSNGAMIHPASQGDRRFTTWDLNEGSN